MGADRPELPVAALTEEQGRALVALARYVIGARLLGRPWEPAEPEDPVFRAPGASFVTIERGGSLRGCIGMLDAVRPLYRDVAENATRAMVDPRLPPVTAVEWDELDVSVSVLSNSVSMAERGVADLARALRPGIDGLILSEGARRATFLPTVWRKLSEPERFVTALLAKGGWSVADAGRLSARRYVATEYHGPASGTPLEPLEVPSRWTIDTPVARENAM